MVETQVMTTEAVFGMPILNKWEQDLGSGSWSHPETFWVSLQEVE